MIFPLMVLRSVALGWVVFCSLATAQQPIPFSHKQHVGMGVACLDCHTGADKRAAATIPSVQKCMLCHAKLGTDKPGVKQVIQYAESKREIPWKRVYGFDPEALVKFRHSPHIQAKIDCSTCHGDMAQATVAEPLVKHNMGTCLTCHRQRNAAQDCTACHY